jgi:hypothetical protein
VAFILKLNPLEVGIIEFLWTFIPWWFCCRSISLLVMSWNYVWKFLQNWRHLNFCMVFNS